MRVKPARVIKPSSKSSTTVVHVIEPRRSKPKTPTTIVEIVEPKRPKAKVEAPAPKPRSRPKVEVDKPRAKSPTPASRSKAITLPTPRVPKFSSRLPLYLLTEPDELVGGHKVRSGLFENPKPNEVRAYEPNDLAYAMLTTRNARYLHVDRIWPVAINQASGLVRDDRKHGWKFKIVQIGEPLLLKAPETWQRLLEGGLAKAPKHKKHPSLLIWPAIKGHVAVIRALLDGGAPIPADDVVMALLRELRV